MNDFTTKLHNFSQEIESNSLIVQIHKGRSKTLANRVRIVRGHFDKHENGSINPNDTKTNALLPMLLATFEEISDYFKLLQTKDTSLGKRVMRYGCDEESFSKWNETLQICCNGLKLDFNAEIFDENQDLLDFKDDMEDLRLNLKAIFDQMHDLPGSVDSVLAVNRKLLDQQQIDRTQYKTLQTIKAEKIFDPKLLRFENVIGSGGFGEVWKARYRGDYVAVKKVPSKSLCEQAKHWLRQEAEFMKKLSHPRIVTCFGILESDGNYCMVMELCTNGSLATFMLTNQSEGVRVRKRIDFAVDIATGMNYLHKLGVIHRDLKLGNVVLDEHDRAKITDFGLSVVKSATQTSLKLNECGTPQYMAPESFGLVPVFGTKSDVYAFAIVLWELSHWQTAYMGISIMEIKDSIKSGERLPVSDKVTHSTKALIVDCWNANPRLRPSFDIIIGRLNNPTENVNDTACPISSVNPELSGIHNKSAKKKKLFTSRREKFLFVALALVVAVLIGGSLGVYFALSSNKTGSQTDPIPVSTITSIFSMAPAQTTATPTLTIARTPFPTATVTTLIRDDANLDRVFGITLDENDVTYVILGQSPANPIVYRVNEDFPATLTLIANLTSDGQGSSSGDQGICYFNKALYVPRLGQLTKIDLKTNTISSFAGSGVRGAMTNGKNSSAVFCGAVYCVVDKTGNIYVSETCRAVRMVNQTGYVSTIASGMRDKPFGLALDASNKLFFSTWSPPMVYSINLGNGLVQPQYGNISFPLPKRHLDGYGLSSQFSNPSGLVFDELDNLYIAETGSCVISKANRSNFVSVFAGSLTAGTSDGIGNLSSFRGVRQMAFSSKGNLIVTDTYAHSIRILSW